MRYLRDVVLEASKKVIKIDTSKITAPEIRFATDKETDVNKSDAIIAKSCGMTLKDLQGLPFPDYQQLVRSWWNVVLTPLEDIKIVEMDEDDAKKYGIEFGQIVKVVKIGTDTAPNSVSAST